jgi:hypothetical protein
LLTYAIAVLMNGEMPESNLPQQGEITPLSVEFADVYLGKTHGRVYELAEVMRPFLPETSFWSPLITFERKLRRIQMMPSAIRQYIANYMAEHGHRGLSAQAYLDSRQTWQALSMEFPGLSGEITRRTGIEVGFMVHAWRDSEGLLDDAWRALHQKLLDISAAKGCK